MNINTKTIAFFGATGDCAGYCLAHALKAGNTCIALARTPSKLSAAMKAKGVPASTLDSHLSIIQGDAKDPSAVKQALRASNSNGMVEYIVSGVGSIPQLQWSLWHPVTLNDTTICQDVGNTILAAASELARELRISPSKRPFLLNVSTTGIPAPSMPRDVPLLFYPLYVWFLHVPHEDKRVLEATLAAQAKLSEDERGIRGFVNVKPSLLIDGEGLGSGLVREGGEDRPAVGYTIRRADVGRWMFERGIQGDVEGKREYVDRSVTITY